MCIKEEYEIVKMKIYNCKFDDFRLYFAAKLIGPNCFLITLTIFENFRATYQCSDNMQNPPLQYFLVTHLRLYNK